MTDTFQLEQLQNEKSSIEQESQELEEEQRQLKLRAKSLTEKIIQELKKRNNIKQESVNKLQTKVNELEKQLNTLSISSVSDANDLPEDNEREEEMKSADDDSVSITEVAEEIDEDIDPKDKRKRKFF
jgi:chromosome segregation ATPase